MPTFAQMKNDADSPQLIHKALEAVGFLAPMSVAFPATIFGAGGSLVALTGFWPVGLTDPVGWKFGGTLEKDAVESLGYSVPTREDTTKAPKEIEVTLQETDRKPIAEMIYGIDLTGVIPDATTGAITFNEPDLPAHKDFRLIVISRDGTAAQPYFRGRGFPRVALSSVDPEVWSAKDPRLHPLKFSVLVDPTVGTPVRHWIGGAGMSATDLGFTP